MNLLRATDSTFTIEATHSFRTFPTAATLDVWDGAEFVRIPNIRLLTTTDCLLILNTADAVGSTWTLELMLNSNSTSPVYWKNWKIQRPN